MPSMTYCRHENTVAELEQVWELWDDWSEASSNDYEARARKRLIWLVREMHEQFVFDGTYGEEDSE
jgi:hypothetical protein